MRPATTLTIALLLLALLVAAVVAFFFQPGGTDGGCRSGTEAACITSTT